MDILTAFLAFSAVMIVLATMATVIVEVVHKLLRQRKRDFEKMLENYYKGSVKPLVDGVGIEAAKDFVATIRRNPAFAGEDKAEDSSATRGFFFDTAFEHLTTSQFVEQLARSNIGQDISAQVQKGEDHLIEQLAAEFERYGDAAHDYFRRRAQVLSLFAAMLLAFTLNVDAVRLFQAFSSDNELANQVIAQIDPDEWHAKYLVAKQGASREKGDLEETIKKARADLKTDAEVLSKLNLPIGHAFFPFCSDSGLLASDVALNTKSQAHVDARCNTLASKQLQTKQSQLQVLLGSWEFFKWFINAVLAGLLIGLGAPFWFKTYRFIVDFVPSVNQGKTTEVRESLSGNENVWNHPESHSDGNIQAAVAGDPRTESAALPLAAKPLNERRLTTLFRYASGVSVENTDGETK